MIRVLNNINVKKMNKDFYTRLGNDQLNNIREKYKVIQVPWLDSV